MYPTRPAPRPSTLDKPIPPKRPPRRPIRPRHKPEGGRAAATRDTIVQAACRCLEFRGFAGATTAAVAQYAEVAEATLFRHFAGKNELLAKTVERTLQDLAIEFGIEVNERVSKGARIESRMKGAVGALWAIFKRHKMRAIFEVYVAARTDPELDARLAPILAAHREGIIKEARALLPEVAHHADLELAVDTIVFAMQGTVLGMFGEGARDDLRHLRTFERLGQIELEHMMGIARR